jgi:hypothetical protein
MTTINIGTNKKNITNIKIDKPFKEITYQDIVKIVREMFSDMKGINIQGWADVSHVHNNLKNKVLDTAHLLNDKILTAAFHILFDKDWKKDWAECNKAAEMRSIFNGGTQPCRPFENWVKCIEFLSLHCT